MSADETMKETTQEAPATGSPEVEEASAKRPTKRWPIILGVALVVVIAAGIGFFVWHEQPSFCNAICHTPMDAINATYDQEPGAPGIDKYGNEVKNTMGLLAVSHQANDLDVTCLECHVPQMSEQITEGIEWATGNYDVVENKNGQYLPPETTLEDLVEARQAAGLIDEGHAEQFCLTSGCHVTADGDAMTLEDLKESTAGLAHNPHDFYHGDVDCSDCHKAHRASINICSECHANAELPEGWLTYAEGLDVYVPVAA